MVRRSGTPTTPDEADEGPSAADLERFSDVTRTCPKCGAEMYDDVEICWKCGHSLMAREAGTAPKWVIVAAVVVLASFVVFSIRGC